MDNLCTRYKESIFSSFVANLGKGLVGEKKSLKSTFDQVSN
jgi:hypothetical protein